MPVPSPGPGILVATWLPVESPWAWVGVAAGVAAVSFLVWAQSADLRFLVAAGLAGLAGAGAIVTDQLVLTDRERIEALFPRLAEAAETGDHATILAAFAPEAGTERDAAAEILEQFTAEEVRITTMEVDVPDRSPALRARAEFLVRTRGTLRGATPWSGIVAFDVQLRRDGDRWLIVDVEIPDERPLGRR